MNSKEDIVSKYACRTHDIDSMLTQQRINRELERSNYSSEWLDNQSKLVIECLSHLSVNERWVVLDYLLEKRQIVNSNFVPHLGRG